MCCCIPSELRRYERIKAQWTDNNGIINEFGSTFTNSGMLYNNNGMLTYGGAILIPALCRCTRCGGPRQHVGHPHHCQRGHDLHAYDCALLDGSATIDSGGELYNEASSGIYAYSASSITNSGLLMNAGLLRNYGTVNNGGDYNSGSGTLNNLNNGTITVTSGGTTWNVGTLNNYNIYTVEAGGNHNDYMGTFVGNIVDDGNIGLYNTGASCNPENISGNGTVFSYASGTGRYCHRTRGQQ